MRKSLLKKENTKLRKALDEIRLCCVYTARPDMKKEYERAWREQSNIAKRALNES